MGLLSTIKYLIREHNFYLFKIWLVPIFLNLILGALFLYGAFLLGRTELSEFFAGFLFQIIVIFYYFDDLRMLIISKDEVDLELFTRYDDRYQY